MITVVTPTFNREEKLHICYDSLCKQNTKEFVWLVVDDGSVDNTKELIKKYIQENEINIQYLSKENGGKASALNVALDVVTSEYVVCLDSDDWLVPNAIGTALKELSLIRDDDECCGILALKNYYDGTIIGGKEIPQDYLTIRAEDIFISLNYNTELMCFYKTECIKQYRFPVFKNEKFVSPAWMQYKVSETYYFLKSNNIFCCCEYYEDGLTRNKKEIIKRNPNGYTAVKLLSFNKSKKIKLIIKNGIMYNYGTILSGDSEWLTNSKHKVWTIILRPFGYAVKIIRNKRK